ncbi:bifunctional folylpolyglutamate synthase/dihydrofolate synthase, partial [bacterium]
TTISKDHEAYLGSDLLSIAREKGGIIKPAVPLVCGSLTPEVGGLLREMAALKKSASYFSGRDFSFSIKDSGVFDYNGLSWRFTDLALALSGRYQRGNAALVLGALEVTQEKFPVSEAAVREGLKTVFWPGRLEVIWQRPMVILDGAHNGEGVRALVEEMRNLQGLKNKAKLLFAAMKDKDWSLMLGELADVASEVVLTRVSMERSADPSDMAKAVPSNIPYTIIGDSREAMRFQLEKARPDDVILVTGSLYLLGEVRPLILKMRGVEARSRMAITG